MRRVYLLVALLIGVFFTSTIINVEAVTLDDLNKMSPNTAAQVLLQLGSNTVEEPSHLEQADEWVSFAERLGKALTSLARETGMAVNEFAKTPVGVIAIFILLWKTIGISMVAGLVWVLGITVTIWSFRKFHVPVKNTRIVRDANNNPLMEEGKVKEEVKYIRQYDFSSKEARLGSVWGHAGMFMLTNVMLIIAIAVS